MTTQRTLHLKRHPSAAPGPVRSIQVTVQRTAEGELELEYRLDGDLSRIQLPSRTAFAAGRELWRHTCLEAFIAIDGEPAYHEYNFAPSGEWTLYVFRRYRDGRRLTGRESLSQIEVDTSPRTLALKAIVRLDRLSAAHARAPLRIGLSAVVETSDGFSYWALHHAGPKPDFHCADGFSFALPSPNRPDRKARAKVNPVLPRDLNRRRVEQLLRKIRGAAPVGKRIDIISRSLLGLPYTPNPLIGSASTGEIFTAALDGFDCVTYIETVLALSLAAGVRDFCRLLRNLRYEGGQIRWNRRNHYMTAWLRNNRRQGIVSLVSIPGVSTVLRERVLSVVRDLPPRRMRIECIPKRSMRRALERLRNGDLVFFVSTRRNLDVFHAGILVGDGVPATIRHASRSAGGVVEQKIADFLRTNRMTGIILARPRDIRRSGAARK